MPLAVRAAVAGDAVEVAVAALGHTGEVRWLDDRLAVARDQHAGRRRQARQGRQHTAGRQPEDDAAAVCAAVDRRPVEVAVAAEGQIEGMAAHGVGTRGVGGGKLVQDARAARRRQPERRAAAAAAAELRDAVEVAVGGLDHVVGSRSPHVDEEAGSKRAEGVEREERAVRREPEDRAAVVRFSAALHGHAVEVAVAALDEAAGMVAVRPAEGVQRHQRVNLLRAGGGDDPPQGQGQTHARQADGRKRHGVTARGGVMRAAPSAGSRPRLPHRPRRPRSDGRIADRTAAGSVRSPRRGPRGGPARRCGPRP